MSEPTTVTFTLPWFGCLSEGDKAAGVAAELATRNISMDAVDTIVESRVQGGLRREFVVTLKPEP